MQQWISNCLTKLYKKQTLQTFVQSFWQHLVSIFSCKQSLSFNHEYLCFTNFLLWWSQVFQFIFISQELSWWIINPDKCCMCICHLISRHESFSSTSNLLMFDLWKKLFWTEFRPQIFPKDWDLINKPQPKLQALKEIYLTNKIETTRKSVKDEIQFCES